MAMEPIRKGQRFAEVFCVLKQKQRGTPQMQQRKRHLKNQ